MSDSCRLSPILISLAAILSAAALAAAAPRTGSAGAEEARDEKGRTPAEVAEEVRQGQEAKARRRASQARAKEARLRSLVLPSDAGECLAYHRVERRCLVTAGDFNRRLHTDQRWSEAPRDTGAPAGSLIEIRKAVVSAILQERFADAMYGSREQAGDSADAAWRAHFAGMVGASDDARLRALYRKHAATFGPRREVQAEFLGASDSSFLDSLLRCMLVPGPAAAAPGESPGAKGCASGPGYQWGKLQPGDLPDEWTRVTGSLREGEVSEIVRGRFGWFAVAAVRVKEVPGKTFEESRPILAYMEGIPEPSAPSGGSGPTPAAPGVAFPGGEAAPPEDPVLTVRLLPATAAGKGGKLRFPSWSDTARVDPLRMRLTDMPAGLRCEARALLRREGRGILRSRFGTWYLATETQARAAKPGDSRPCAPEAEAPPAPPDPAAIAQEILASKEKDFKLSFQEARLQGSDVNGPGPGGSPSRLARWMAENVALEDDALERF